MTRIGHATCLGPSQRNPLSFAPHTKIPCGEVPYMKIFTFYTMLKSIFQSPIPLSLHLPPTLSWPCWNCIVVISLFDTPFHEHTYLFNEFILFKPMHHVRWWKTQKTIKHKQWHDMIYLCMCLCLKGQIM
jgi:hypothetical protein